MSQVLHPGAPVATAGGVIIPLCEVKRSSQLDQARWVFLSKRPNAVVVLTPAGAQGFRMDGSAVDVLALCREAPDLIHMLPPEVVVHRPA